MDALDASPRTSQVICDSLQKHGYWRAPDPWDGITDYMAYLRDKPAYNGHVLSTGDGVARSLEDALAQTTGENCGYACHSMQDTLAGPGLLDFILPMTELAQEYFGGETARLYSVNAFWKKSFADHDWHFDQDDRKIFVMFMYGTDILTMKAGPHAYIRDSHLWSGELKDWLHKSKVTPAEDSVENFYGPAGTYFFTDTKGLHNGIAPEKKPRLLIWARWGVSNPPPSYDWDHLAPVPESRLPFTGSHYSQEIRERTKLIIDWDT